VRYFLGLALAVLSAAVALNVPPAWAERRIALSVGIDLYDNLPAHGQLKKAVNDARAMDQAFAGLGFETAREENVTRQGFLSAWQRFLNRLQPGDTAALFFAGHGVEINGANYLVARDVPNVGPREEKLLAGASIRFDELLHDLRERRVGLSLFIVDACRENPFRDTRGRFVGSARGLKRVEDAVKGSFILYSAGYGEKALDRLSATDAAPTSPYTRTLIPLLKTPGLSLQEIAKRVRADVVALMRKAEPPHEQTPAYYDQVVGDVVLKPGKAVALPPPPPSPQGPDVAQAWAMAKGSRSLAVLEAFRQQYGRQNAFYDQLAKERIDALRQEKLAVVVPPPPPVGLSPYRSAAPLTAADERALKPRDAFKECAACPEMVVVPAGSFMMGSPPNEAERDPDEGPQRRVTLVRPFAVGKFEVSFAEWDACLAEAACTYRPDDAAGGRRGRQPVTNVSWNDITRQYLPWLSRKTGKGYRLLTEAEWEYAARADTTTRYAFGDTITTGQAAFAAGIVPVGSFPPNAFGLHDMHGNAWEWVQDCGRSGSGNYNGAPLDGTAWTTGNCSLRHTRGGSPGPTRYLRSANRDTLPLDARNSTVGFRVGRTL
jgi:formylglycine-generating enzyme required for sulfatase activity